MLPSIKIDPKLLIRTCTACPSQWESTLEDGRMLYINFRYDELVVSVSYLPTTNIEDAINAQIILELTSVTGDGMCSYLSDNDLNKLLSELNLSSDPSFISEEKEMVFTLDGFENVTTITRRKNDKSS